MLDDVPPARKLPKAEYEQRSFELRVELLRLQRLLRESDFSVVVVVEGLDRPGCNEVLNLLHAWLDTRGLEAHAFLRASPWELERPLFWRYWSALPPDGKIGVFTGAWTWHCIRQRVEGELGARKMRARLERIRRFEEALASDGNVVVKIWQHLPERELAERVRRARANDLEAWQITEGDAALVERYERLHGVADEVLSATSRASARWHAVDSTEDRHRDLEVGRILCEALGARFEPRREAPARKSRQSAGGEPAVSSLAAVDLDAKVPKKEYERRLQLLQASVLRSTTEAWRRGLSSVLVFEGQDAAGKGGAIRRLTAAMQAAHYRVVAISAPTEEERARHYLWRFWRHLPRAGHALVFDRSWYGRVLVERVEGYAQPEEWRRAYREIVDFEEQLVEAGSLLLKFWLQIDADEQLHRFRAREQVEYKRHKITPEDWRNREKWSLYERAVEDMLARTDGAHAHWHLVAANDKRHARLEVLGAYARALEEALERHD